MDIYTTREVLKNNLTSIFDLNLRVAYYARVSTEKEEQKVSLEHQQDYYREYIQSKNNWIFVDILMMVFLQSVPPSEKNFNGWF